MEANKDSAEIKTIIKAIVIVIHDINRDNTIKLQHKILFKVEHGEMRYDMCNKILRKLIR